MSSTHAHTGTHTDTACMHTLYSRLYKIYKYRTEAVFTKHLKAKSSSQLADLGETHKIYECFTAKTAPKCVKS